MEQEEEMNPKRKEEGSPRSLPKVERSRSLSFHPREPPRKRQKRSPERSRTTSPGERFAEKPTGVTDLEWIERGVNKLGKAKKRERKAVSTKERKQQQVAERSTGGGTWGPGGESLGTKEPRCER